jgi:FkbM family methyltransferase
MSRAWDEFWRLYFAGRWEPDTRDLLYRTLEPGDLFVDVGAWIGPVTLWALDRKADVIAIEPDPVACAELRTQVGDRVEIWKGAVVAESGPVRLAPRRGELGNSMSRLTDDGPVEVQGWTLPEILGDRVPKLVKVDVEGYETELLPAIGPYLAGLGVPLSVALHPHLTGIRPSLSWFEGYRRIDHPRNPRGNLVAVP